MANTYIHLKATKDFRFEALFVMLGSIRAALHTLRPFYALGGTHTRSRYNNTPLLAVGIDNRRPYSSFSLGFSSWRELNLVELVL
jgi:hypothetical protein